MSPVSSSFFRVCTHLELRPGALVPLAETDNLHVLSLRRTSPSPKEIRNGSTFFPRWTKSVRSTDDPIVTGGLLVQSCGSATTLSSSLCYCCCCCVVVVVFCVRTRFRVGIIGPTGLVLSSGEIGICTLSQPHVQSRLWQRLSSRRRKVICSA